MVVLDGDVDEGDVIVIDMKRAAAGFGFVVAEDAVIEDGRGIAEVLKAIGLFFGRVVVDMDRSAVIARLVAGEDAVLKVDERVTC